MSGPASIVLSTINATYTHPSFGLRCLLANLGDLRSRTRLVEFYRRQPSIDRVVHELLAFAPRMVGFGVYIWNVDQLTEVVRRLKTMSPDTIVILGGPEVSHETAGQPIVTLADYVVCGEGEEVFPDLCRRILRGESPAERVVHAQPPDLRRLADPYPEYTSEDIAKRVVYVETSRGCPFRCEYCLSSLDATVRLFALEPVMASLDALLAGGATRFKFIDRTFNLNINRCISLLEFFLERLRPGLSIQFEIVPTRMPGPLKAVLLRFPPDTLRLEVGVQTLAADVLERIQRTQDPAKTHDTLRFLSEESQAVVHADLIVGLPGESLDRFARSFNAVLRWKPAELQVGILKRLRGVPIVRHDEPWQMHYRPDPPYDLLSSGSIPAEDMDRMRGFARTWDRVWNSGRFQRTALLVVSSSPSAFDAFLRFSDWLYAHHGSTRGMPLLVLVEALYVYLCETVGFCRVRVAAALAEDYQRDARRALPRYLNVGARQPDPQESSVPHVSESMPKWDDMQVGQMP